MGIDWKQALMAAGAAAGVAAVLHYLLKEEEESESKVLAAQLGGTGAGEASSELEMIHMVLAELLGSQDKMKSAMKDLTKDLLAAPHTFAEAYQKVQTVQPSDPLEKCGLSMEAFDQMVSKHQNDPVVREAIMRMMGAPTPSTKAPSVNAMEITVKTLIDVHKFMAEGLTAIVADVEDTPNKASLDGKTAMMAAQTIVAAKVEAKFDVTSEDLEAAVIANQEKLQNSQEFAMVSQEMQTVMTKLMGAIGAK